jgi:hypothetical protein
MTALPFLPFTRPGIDEATIADVAAVPHFVPPQR